jgi:hypothetical protein
MQGLNGFVTLAAVVGCALFMDPSIAAAQVAGAVQYPPLSVGEDAQPPPPARTAPQSILPHRIELGVSGSSRPPGNYDYQLRLRNGVGGFTPPTAAAPPSTASGD